MRDPTTIQPWLVQKNRDRLYKNLTIIWKIECWVPCLFTLSLLVCRSIDMPTSSFTTWTQKHWIIVSMISEGTQWGKHTGNTVEWWPWTWKSLDCSFKTLRNSQQTGQQSWETEMKHGSIAYTTGEICMEMQQEHTWQMSWNMVCWWELPANSLPNHEREANKASQCRFPG